MKHLYDKENLEKKTATHKTEIKCIECGKIGFVDEENCPSSIGISLRR